MREEPEHHQSYSKLVEQYHPMLVRISGFYTNRKEDQEDLYQEIVYQLWKSWYRFQGNAKRSTWLYRLAVNTGSKYRRDHLSKRDKEDEFGPEEVIHTSSQRTEEEIEVNEKLNLLYRGIDQLSPKDQKIVLLYLEQLEYAEIAEIMDMTVSAVGVRLHRIREKLQTIIKPQEKGYGS